ncbi:MAG: glutamine synthetase III [Fusobacteriaceae bacterium]
MKNMLECYGQFMFSEKELQNRVPASVYKEFKLVQKRDQSLSLEVAHVIASAVKSWATENGATHFTHWFQPLTELTAEKHESFIAIDSNGNTISQFSGKDIIKGEADTSSFPNGGLRSTFEARGYTAWDTSSPMFLKGEGFSKTLYIPTAFIGYNGEALDKKVPLLRSIRALEKQALRIQKFLGDEGVKHIDVNLGVEQEYFLVQEDLFEKREDLALLERTLFGSLPSKGQELNDHYYGTIKEKVRDFMADVDAELWKIGVMAKTKHNEVAPNQFELAVLYNNANVSVDQNQLVMDTLRKVALRHGVRALLHEKPFAGVNGSGKHCNWSINTDKNYNLLDPSSLADGNLQFLIYLMAIIEAVNKFAPILRASTCNPGNDYRLGGHEAPPAIISMFIGDELKEIMDNIESFKSSVRQDQELKIGVKNFPRISQDISDRNRTSPFAFTGNKFEFRMPGSSTSPATPVFILNTIVADVLREYADIFETYNSYGESEIKNKKIIDFIKERYSKHSQIIFNGNGYEQSWIDEAKKRGLCNINNSIEGVKIYSENFTRELFERTKVLTASELDSRFKIATERYTKEINIEVLVATRMVKSEILPAVGRYVRDLAESIKISEEALGKLKVAEEYLAHDKKQLLEILKLKSCAHELLEDLQRANKNAHEIKDEYEKGIFYKDKVIPIMKELRNSVDALELLVEKNKWAIPTYYDLLFKLN